MKPWKNFTGFASWVIRIALVLVIYTRFFGIFLQFNVNNQNFYFAAAFVLFAVLLLIGGFFRQSLSVIAGLGIFILAVVKIILGFNGIEPALAQWLLMAGTGLYFLANGNK